jgi:hypothetical protein
MQLQSRSGADRAITQCRWIGPRRTHAAQSSWHERSTPTVDRLIYRNVGSNHGAILAALRLLAFFFASRACPDMNFFLGFFQ